MDLLKKGSLYDLYRYKKFASLNIYSHPIGTKSIRFDSEIIVFWEYFSEADFLWNGLLLVER